MKLSKADKARLVSHLNRTIAAIEEVLAAGLTTASDATAQTIAVTFQEASRMQLLRLGSTLRSTHDEMSRFVKDDPRFSQSRLMFFLHRSWLLSKGIQRALNDDDTEALKSLLRTTNSLKTKSLELVCLGVVKKIATGTFCAFDFRFRSKSDGRAMTWSTVFPIKPGTDIPAEGYLHLPQKQKFSPACFLERKVIHISHALTSETNGSTRLQLMDDSQVSTGEAIDDWEDYLTWDAKSALLRVEQHVVSPFDMEVELQEEVVIGNYQIGAAEEDAERQRIVFPLTTQGVEFDLTVSSGLDGESALTTMQKVAKQKPQARKPILFGTLHYASCRFVLQPLTLVEAGKPNYITISDQSIDRKALLSALKFT